MLGVIYNPCHIFIVMLSVVMLRVVMVSVVAPFHRIFRSYGVVFI
jgi:hypothetical protein